MDKNLKVKIYREGLTSCSVDAERLKESEPKEANNYKIEFEGILIDIITTKYYNQESEIRGIVVKKDGSIVKCWLREMTVLNGELFKNDSRNYYVPG